jgi:zinc and cadmium transporter
MSSAAPSLSRRNWERSYLRYFVALGAGFMLATALVEMVPESINLRGPYAGFLILGGYLLVHFFEHTVTPHFHFGEETHADSSCIRTRDIRFSSAC